MKKLLKNTFRVLCIMITVIYFLNCLIETNIDIQTFNGNSIMFGLIMGGGLLGNCFAQLVLIVLESIDYYYEAKEL